MQATSEVWKSLWAAGAALEARAMIGGTAYAPIAAPVITRAAMGDALAVGNAVSAGVTLALRTNAAIPRAAQVRLEMRLTDGQTASEWLPAGTFYISRRAKDPVTGVLALECFDAMLKANAVLKLLPWTTNTGEVVTTDAGEPLMFTAAGQLPMAELARDLAWLLGVDWDARNALATGGAYMLDLNSLPEETTIHDALERIAAANGGNWIITPAGKLRLVPLDDANADTVAVDGVVGALEAEPAAAVTGVRYRTEDGGEVTLGDGSGLLVDIGQSAAFAGALYARFTGLSHQAYRLAGAVYDPATELGDRITAGADGEVSSVLWEETATLAPAFRGNAAAPRGGEVADEYPYIGGAASKALSAARAYAREVTGALDDSLDQEAIFNRLTDNGAAQGMLLYEGQLYINATYINAGTMVANRIRGGTLTLGGLNNINGVLVMLDDEGNEIGRWDSGNVTAKAFDFDGNIDSQISITNPYYAILNRFNRNGLYLHLPDNYGHYDISLNMNPADTSNPNGIGITVKRVYDTGTPATDYTTEINLNENIRVTRNNDSGDDYQIIIGAGGILLYENGTMGSSYGDSAKVNGDLNVLGSVKAGNGWSGQFQTGDGRTVQVTKGIITDVS